MLKNIDILNFLAISEQIRANTNGYQIYIAGIKSNPNSGES